MDTTTPLTPATLREPDAAKYLSVSCSFLRRARMTGRTKSGSTGPAYVKVGGGRTVIYRVCDLDSWLASNLRGGAA